MSPFLVLAMLSAANLRIAPVEGTRFALEVEKTGLLSGKKHLILFEKYSGKLEYDSAQPERSKLTLEIEARSAVIKDDWSPAKGSLEKIYTEMQTASVLDSAKYPKITFASERIAAKGSGQFEVTGPLTIRNVTKPVTVLVTQKGDLYEGVATVKLSDYKIKAPKAALGAIGTKDEMKVSFTLKPGA